MPLVSRRSIKFYKFVVQVVLWFKIDREDFEMKETEVLNVVKNNLRT